MRLKLTLLSVIILTGSILGAEQPKKYIKVTILGPGTAAIYCTNGADATLIPNPQIGLQIVSCGTP